MTPRRIRPRSLLMTALLTSSVLHAADNALPANSDDAALQLADTTSERQTAPRDWSLLTELAWAGAQLRQGDAPDELRISVDGHFDHQFAPDWRLVFADRLDARWDGSVTNQHSVNTLKEIYVNWQAQPDTLFDLGRVNTRYGVGTGFNPTDFFKIGAIRSVTSVDPASLRDNRLGSVMVRGQRVWDGGSITALYSPKLADAPDNEAFNPDWGASNPRDRWLIAGSQSFGDNLNPQFLLYHDEGQTQLGANWSVLLGDATVAYIEWAGGKGPSLQTRAQGGSDLAFHGALATGVTWTAPNKLSVTLEYQRDNSAANASQWQALQQGSPAIYQQYRAVASSRQALTTREGAMIYASWQDALVQHLDLTAFVRFDLIDHSHLNWLQASWRGTWADLALQWQYDAGTPLSNYGALPQRQVWQAILTHYF